MSDLSKRNALKFVILLSFVCFFADMTYEGARSITGQYLSILGATGITVSLVAGFGELVGYSLRLLSGYICDKTGKYWLITIIGYSLNVLVVPIIALVGNWESVAFLIVLERLGKAIRSPAKDAMLSYATKSIGRGFGFGLHKAMDQMGAVIGPLIISTILYYQEGYRVSFAILLIPALCTLSVLFVARMLYPRPQDLEVESKALKTEGFTKQYWLYIAAITCVAAGYVNFPLIAYHLKKVDVLSDVWIPVFFSAAMTADAISALVFGRMYDLKGFSTLIFVTVLSSFFSIFVFTDGFYSVLVGMILWGIGMGAQESVMRAVVANMVQMDLRGFAYGILNMFFGVGWFIGSVLMGLLYDISIPSLIVFSLLIQGVAILLLIKVKKTFSFSS